MAQGEPENDDAVKEASGFSFAVEKDLADSISSFDIDYRNGWLSKGFAVYPNGHRSSC